MHDPVHRPSHYLGNGVEAIDVIEGWGLGFHLGNAMKYVLRHRGKGRPGEDLDKAVWYLVRARGEIAAGRPIASGKVAAGAPTPQQIVTAFGFEGCLEAREAIFRVTLAAVSDTARSADVQLAAAIAMVRQLGEARAPVRLREVAHGRQH